MIAKKVKAGALQLIIFIVVLIALLLASFIILIDTHNRFNLQSSFVIETVTSANKGINYTIHNTIKLNDTTTFDLKDEDYKSLKVHRDFWGLFEKITSTSKIKSNQFKKVALIGAVQPNENRTALYLQDNNKPLVLVGHTKIQGLAYLPKQGAKSGNISGQSYYGSQLIYGKSLISSRLPKLQEETINHIKDDYKKTASVSQNQFLDISQTLIHKNSFFNPLQIAYSNSKIVLDEVTLIGHIQIISKTKITVKANSTIKDVILIAPEIEILNNTIGAFQAIATHNIIVGENCKINYPSALILSNNKFDLNSSNPNSIIQSSIEIKKNATLKGVVAFIGKSPSNNFKPQIVINENATVIGEIYCTQNTELKGSVLGTIFTSNFIANQSGSVYQNHIYNGNIIIDELPQEFVGLPFENSKKGVLKWLY